MSTVVYAHVGDHKSRREDLLQRGMKGRKGLETFISLHKYYLKYVLKSEEPCILGGVKSRGLYYLGSHQTPPMLLSLIQIASDTFKYLGDDVLDGELKPHTARIIRGPYGVNDKEICGVRTDYGILWYSGAPGRNAPKY